MFEEIWKYFGTYIFFNLIEHFGLFEKKNSSWFRWKQNYLYQKQSVARFFETDHHLGINFAYNCFMKNQIMNALVAASVRCFCCVHKFIDFAWVRKPFIFSLTHDLFWMDIQCSWVRRMSRMSHCDSEQKIKKMKQHFSSVLPHFFTRKQCHAHC